MCSSPKSSLPRRFGLGLFILPKKNSIKIRYVAKYNNNKLLLSLFWSPYKAETRMDFSFPDIRKVSRVRRIWTTSKNANDIMHDFVFGYDSRCRKRVVGANTDPRGDKKRLKRMKHTYVHGSTICMPSQPRLISKVECAGFVFDTFTRIEYTYKTSPLLSPWTFPNQDLNWKKQTGSWDLMRPGTA